MARKMKGGFGESTMIPLVLTLVALGVVVAVLVMVKPTEKFTPTAPSASGDKKEVTPSGNVILY
jgi:hypothetical protein